MKTIVCLALTGAALRAAESRVVARWRIRFIRLSLLTLSLLLVANISAAAGAGRTIVVRNDAGGSVVQRARLIRQYRANGTRLEIRGDFCMSACTMYLGLGNTCVAPDTVFGFHGPSSPIYGIALPPRVFERWSRIMADSYPEPLRTWFWETGRQRIVGFQTFRGAQLIEMGITACA